MTVRVGIAGWSVPSAQRRAANAASLLEHYAHLYNAVEINSSFYRPHQERTYARWAATVPEHFRFAVKMPKHMTHELRLGGCAPALREFLRATEHLGSKLGVYLLQLPPSFGFDAAVACEFFACLRRSSAAPVVCEARHPSWFAAPADQLLTQFSVGRVTADPVPAGCEWHGTATAGPIYYRLHGAPRMYYSAYTPETLARLALELQAGVRERTAWCIFDNTAAGAAWLDAALFAELLAQPRA